MQRARVHGDKNKDLYITPNLEMYVVLGSARWIYRPDPKQWSNKESDQRFVKVDSKKKDQLFVFCTASFRFSSFFLPTRSSFSFHLAHAHIRVCNDVRGPNRVKGNS